MQPAFLSPESLALFAAQHVGTALGTVIIAAIAVGVLRLLIATSPL